MLSQPIHFANNNVFFYHTTHNRFQSATADFTGEFPRNISFYSLGKLQVGVTGFNQSVARTAGNPSASADSSHAEIHISSTQTSQSKSVRGRPRKSGPRTTAPEMTPPALISASTSTSASGLSESSVYVCAWVPVPNTEYIAPEVWRLHLSPDELVECMDVSQKISDLDCDFQGCMAVSGGRLRILGTAPVAAAPTTGMKRRHIRDENSDDSMGEDDQAGLGAATWNIFFDIDLLH